MQSLTDDKVRNAEFGMHQLPPLVRGGQGGSRSTFRHAFTLVEMMVVIVIIGVLAGLIIPALMRARIAAVEARVITELKQLETGITNFKAKYGVEPPSRFNLYLTQAGWTSDPTSMAIVRRIWPQFDFTMGGVAVPGTVYPAFWSSYNVINANGTFPGLQMNSSECLLFFLGGIIPNQGPNQIPIGFAKNPVWPFAPIVGSANANREGPFFELTDVSRIKDFNGNGINEWYDSIPNQTSPILYFSSYEGSGYRVTGPASELPPATTLVDVYRVSSTAGTFPPASQAAVFPGVPPDSRSLPAQKAQTFQLISPGYDGKYGFGGVFNPSLANAGLFDPSGTPDIDAYDNLTNFNGGRLKP